MPKGIATAPLYITKAEHANESALRRLKKRQPRLSLWSSCYGYQGGSVLQKAATKCGAEGELFLTEANTIWFPWMEVCLPNRSRY
jgi:hypothetical protein